MKRDTDFQRDLLGDPGGNGESARRTSVSAKEGTVTVTDAVPAGWHAELASLD
jgi:hypothetical protein